MAVTSAQITSLILASAAFPGGPTWPALAQAIGLGVFNWATGQPTNLALRGVTAGTAGSGIVTGTLVVPPDPAPLLSAMSAVGSGVTSLPLCSAIALGISSAYTASGTYQGSSVGVSSGSDVSVVFLSNPVTLVSSLLASMGMVFSSMGGSPGTSSLQIATGLGNGIASLFLQGSGIGIVSPATPLPGPGAGTSPLSIVL